MPQEIDGVEHFTQDEVNSFNKTERLKREAAEKTIEDSSAEKETLLGQIETLKKTAQLSDEQKNQHATEMEDIRQKGLTDAQKQDETIVTLNGKLKQQEVDSDKTINSWESLHHNMLVTNEIMKNLGATETHTAARQVEPIVALLQPQIKVEKTEKGEFVPVVKDFPVKNEEGKIELKDVSIDEAVSGLFANEQFKYLFNEKGKSGSGGGDGGAGGGDGDISDPDKPPEDGKRYRAWRDKHFPKG